MITLEELRKKAKAYDEAIERAKKFIEENPLVQNLNTWIKETFPELRESEDKDEEIKKALITLIQSCDKGCYTTISPSRIKEYTAWLEKQGEQKPTQEIEPFEAEHGKYYYCIKDYFCGGRKQASKGDVVQALRGLPIMGLKDAGEYFLPVNSIKCNSAWSEEDEKMLQGIWDEILANKHNAKECEWKTYDKFLDWLKSLKPQSQWKPSDAQMASITCAVRKMKESACYDSELVSLLNDLKRLKGE